MRIVQASWEDVSWIASLEAETYSPPDAIPESVLQSWFSRNASGFSIIHSQRNEPIGHLDVLPLIPKMAAPFFHGTILEREIAPGWLVPNQDRTSPRDLYVESLIIKRQPGLASRLALLQVFAQFETIVRRICEPGVVENVYAIEASAAGKKLMLHLGFERCETEHPRRDGHELFKATLGAMQNRMAK